MPILSDGETCSSEPSYKDLLLLVILLGVVVLLFIYKITCKVPIGKNILCLNTHYFIFERLGVMNGGELYFTMPFWRKTIKDRDGKTIDLSETFKSKIRIEPDYSDIGMEFELILDIEWSISDFKKFIFEFEKYLYNTKKYDYIDGKWIIYHFEDFIKDTLDSYDIQESKDFGIISEYISHFKKLEEIGIKIVKHTQVSCSKVTISMKKKREKKDFEEIRRILSDTSLFPSDFNNKE